MTLTRRQRSLRAAAEQIVADSKEITPTLRSTIELTQLRSLEAIETLAMHVIELTDDLDEANHQLSKVKQPKSGKETHREGHT